MFLLEDQLDHLLCDVGRNIKPHGGWQADQYGIFYAGRNVGRKQKETNTLDYNMKPSNICRQAETYAKPFIGLFPTARRELYKVPQYYPWLEKVNDLWCASFELKYVF